MHLPFRTISNVRQLLCLFSDAVSDTNEIHQPENPSGRLALSQPSLSLVKLPNPHTTHHCVQNCTGRAKTSNAATCTRCCFGSPGCFSTLLTRKIPPNVGACLRRVSKQSNCKRQSDNSNGWGRTKANFTVSGPIAIGRLAALYRA